MPLLFLLDFLIWGDSKSVINKLASSLSTRWCRAYLEACRYIQGSIMLVLVWEFGLSVKDSWNFNTRQYQSIQVDKEGSAQLEIWEILKPGYCTLCKSWWVGLHHFEFFPNQDHSFTHLHFCIFMFTCSCCNLVMLVIYANGSSHLLGWHE